MRTFFLHFTNSGIAIDRIDTGRNHHPQGVHLKRVWKKTAGHFQRCLDVSEHEETHMNVVINPQKLHSIDCRLLSTSSGLSDTAELYPQGTRGFAAGLTIRAGYFMSFINIKAFSTRHSKERQQ